MGTESSVDFKRLEAGCQQINRQWREKIIICNNCAEYAG